MILDLLDYIKIVAKIMAINLAKLSKIFCGKDIILISWQEEQQGKFLLRRHLIFSVKFIYFSDYRK